MQHDPVNFSSPEVNHITTNNSVIMLLKLATSQALYLAEQRMSYYTAGLPILRWGNVGYLCDIVLAKNIIIKKMDT